jgi:hypothetical protein
MIYTDITLREKHFDGLFFEDICCCRIGELRHCGCSVKETLCCKPGHIVEDSETALQIGTARVTYLPRKDADGVEL